MIWLGAGLLALLFAGFFVGRSGAKLNTLDEDDDASEEDYEVVAEAMSDWGAGATLVLCGIGLIVCGIVLYA